MKRKIVCLIVLMLVLILLLALAFAFQRSDPELSGRTDASATTQTDNENIVSSTQTAAPSEAADEPTWMPQPEEHTAPPIPFPEEDAGAQNQSPVGTEAGAPEDEEMETGPDSGSGDENELPAIPF